MAEEKQRKAAEKAADAATSTPAEKKPAAKKAPAKKAEGAAEKTTAKAAEPKKPAAKAEGKAAEKAPAKKAEGKAAEKPATKKPAAKKAEGEAAEKPAAKKPAGKANEKAAAKTGKTVVIKSAPKTTKAVAEPKKGQLKVTLRRALTGCTKAQIAVAASLGLRRVGDVTFQPDNAATKGKIAKLAFLLTVKSA